MAMYNAVPATFPNSSARSFGNTSIDVAHVLAGFLGGWCARTTRLRTETHERGEVNNVLWVAAPRETFRRPSNGAPEVGFLQRLVLQPPDPWQNLHIEGFDQALCQDGRVHRQIPRRGNHPRGTLWRPMRVTKRDETSWGRFAQTHSWLACR